MDILNKAANGELVGTEKIDGINIFISYSVSDQEVRLARNKTHLKERGLSINEFYLTMQTKPEVAKILIDAAKSFEEVINYLPYKQQEFFFGERADVFYNAEVINDRGTNVLKYDVNAIVIHRVGHMVVGNTGQMTELRNTKKLSELKDMLRNVTTMNNIKFT